MPPRSHFQTVLPQFRIGRIFLARRFGVPALHFGYLSRYLSLIAKKKKNINKKKNRKNKKRSCSNAVLLPDVISEILTRVSLDHLHSRCRLVCKDWRRLTYESNFKLFHAQRTPTIWGYLIGMSHKYNRYHTNFVSINQSSSIPSPSLDFLPFNKKLSILSSSSSYGLLCCFGSNYGYPPSSSYYICKPATREWIEIPKPNTSRNSILEIVIVVIRRNPLHYKLICFSVYTFSTHHYLHIFDSNNWKWEKLNIDHPSLLLSQILYKYRGILVHGAVHWLSKNGLRICAWNIDKESWKIIESPKGIHGDEIYDHDMRLLECEGEIGLLRLSWGERWLELWVLEDYYSKDETRRRWNKNFRVSLEPVYPASGYLSCENIVDLYAKDIVLMKIEDEIIWFNCKTGTHTVALKVPAGYRVHQIHPIHSDLVRCNLASKWGLDPWNSTKKMNRIRWF
ncbi:hypothetical protein BVC80_9073g53 [Macleaya cordata]|uniref:Uncharacterized protein n=1 Tax=Macleaya cordata TaxID=56857 RepID=A0A200PTU4_MACCD|nr:hypothetical protein BVC80_9073g53 [Macleaya cordata]